MNHKENQQSWLAIAIRVINGEYNKVTGTYLKSLIIGLSGLEHPHGKRAIELLKKLKGKK